MIKQFLNRFLVLSSIGYLFAILLSLVFYHFGNEHYFLCRNVDWISVSSSILLVSVGGALIRTDSIRKWVKITFAILAILSLISVVLNIGVNYLEVIGVLEEQATRGSCYSFITTMVSWIYNVAVLLVLSVFVIVYIIKHRETIVDELLKDGKTLFLGSVFLAFILVNLSLAVALVGLSSQDWMAWTSMALCLTLNIGIALTLSCCIYTAICSWKTFRLASFFAIGVVLTYLSSSNYCTSLYATLEDGQEEVMQRTRWNMISGYYEKERACLEAEEAADKKAKMQMQAETEKQYREQEKAAELAAAERKKPFKLDFLWKDKSADSDSIALSGKYVLGFQFVMPNLTDFEGENAITDVEEGGARGFREKGEKAYMILLTYFANNRNNLPIEGIFNAYKLVIRKTISKQQYYDRYKDHVDLLLTSYNNIAEYDSFEAIYNIMSDSERGEMTKFADMSEYIDNYAYYRFVIKGRADVDSLFYFYSFWGRRYHEGNAEAAHNVLFKLNEMFYDEALEDPSIFN